jgi:hypothetical protein
MTQIPLKQYPQIPSALIWVQCITFAMLYAVWMLYELMFFRRIALITGAVLALYPIYQYRTFFLQKRALPLWLMVGLFIWVLFHLFFLSQDYPAQLLELRRIWKYAGLGAVFALGLGLSLASVSSDESNSRQKNFYWAIIYFGLCLPVLIYLLKYALTTYGAFWEISPPAFLKINFDANSAYYVPKTDYIAFCLPVLAISLGQILKLLTSSTRLILRQYVAASIYLLVISATLFLFYIQNTKNGIAYAVALIGLFLLLFLKRAVSIRFWHKLILLLVVGVTTVTMLYSHIQKNDSWRTLIADVKVGLQLDLYPQWKYAGEQGYPNNQFGQMVSVTNYERAAWSKTGAQLALQSPLGYGLVEDSFKRMVKAKWPEASPNLSHSHSGWLDLILGVGLPGFLFILSALHLNIRQSSGIADPWRSLVFWALIANLILWVTTEVAATISFSALIFWISLSCGLTLIVQNREIRTEFWKSDSRSC